MRHILLIPFIVLSASVTTHGADVPEYQRKILTSQNDWMAEFFRKTDNQAVMTMDEAQSFVSEAKIQINYLKAETDQTAHSSDFRSMLDLVKFSLNEFSKTPYLMKTSVNAMSDFSTARTVAVDIDSKRALEFRVLLERIYEHTLAVGNAYDLTTAIALDETNKKQSSKK